MKVISKENILYFLLIFGIAPVICYSILFSNIVIKNTVKPVVFFIIYYIATTIYVLLCILLHNIDYKGYVNEKIEVLSLSQPRNAIIHFLIVFEIEVTFKNHVEVYFKCNDRNISIVLNKEYIKYDLEETQEPYIELLCNKRRLKFKSPILHCNKQLDICNMA